MVEINWNTYTLYLPISDLLYYPLTPTPFLPSHCSVQNLHKVDCKVQSPEFIPESRVQGPFSLLTYAKVDLYFILRGQSAACESCSSWERLGGIRELLSAALWILSHWRTLKICFFDVVTFLMGLEHSSWEVGGTVVGHWTITGSSVTLLAIQALKMTEWINRETYLIRCDKCF